MSGVFDYLTRLLGGMAFWVIVLPWQQGLQVRGGRRVRLLEQGIYLKVPIFDVVKVESVRRRTALVPAQTLSTADGVTITVSAVVGYAISDLERLFRSLHHAEDTIIQIAQGVISASVIRQKRDAIDAAQLCDVLSAQLAEELSPYGLSDISLHITDFAVVRAIRLIQDQRWFHGRALDTQDSSQGAART